MKNVLLFALLGISAWNAHAQPVTASTDVLEFSPVRVPGESPSESVVFTSQVDETILVFGLGANGPFDFDWECSGSDGTELLPRGTCVLNVRFVPPADQPLGLVEGLVGFRLSTGTILVELRGFAYTAQPIAGTRNLRASLEPLGFDPAVIPWLTSRLNLAEAVLLDGNSSNDQSACGHLQAFVRRILQEAARDRVSDWSAASLGVQVAAVAQSLGCGTGLPAR
jgi:hypothetical protein